MALDVLPATRSPRPLTRLSYVGRDGAAVSGVAAFARAVQHLHLGWASVGWLLKVPGLDRFVQLVVDAVGGGPLADPIGGTAGRPANGEVSGPQAGRAHPP